MADENHLKLIRKGTEAWNTWRKQYPETKPDLSNADLRKTNLSGANLSKVNLSRANLREAALSRANLLATQFSYADLSYAKLNHSRLNYARLNYANLFATDLSYADLSGATLNGANLRETLLTGANLKEAALVEATLYRTTLSFAILTGVHTQQTIFDDLDLRTVKGLETIEHYGPSAISTSTLERSQGNIPEVFLRKAGLSDLFITYVRSLTATPIQYYTCFISYSSKDQTFAEHLHADLQQRGIRCWFAPEDLKIGDEFPDRIEEAIRLYDKLLVILSEHSVKSSWVEDEVRAALEKEERLKREQQAKTVLFPIVIDNAIEHEQAQWVALMRRKRHIGDFTGWKNHDVYLNSFQRLIRDLKADPAD